MLLKHLTPALLWAAFILVLCGIPGSQLPEMPFWDIFSFDKAAHVAVFLVLSVLLKVAFLKQHQYCNLRYKCNIIVVLIAAGYGVVIELLQAFVFAERSAEINDMIANTIGACLGLFVFKLIYGNCVKN